MKLREFVDTYDKEFENNPSKRKKTNEKDIPNEGNDEEGNPARGPVKVNKHTCDFCKKEIEANQRWFGDKMGKVYHEECYEKKFGNEDEEKYGSEYPETDPEESKLETKSEKPKERKTKHMAKTKEPKKEVKKPKATKTPAKKEPAKK
jgi:hypothetical protein